MILWEYDDKKLWILVYLWINQLQTEENNLFLIKS